jgi:hypothetical protein
MTNSDCLAAANVTTKAYEEGFLIAFRRNREFQ